MDLRKEDLTKHGLFYTKIENNVEYIRSHDCDTIIRSLISETPPDTELNLFIPTENHLAVGDFSKDTEKEMLEKNIKINFIFGGFYKYKLTEKYDSPENNRYLHLWPTAGIFDSVQNILSVYDIHSLANKGPQNFTYPFISLTHKARTHRCYLIDNLVKHKLLDKGLYTWHHYDQQYPYYKFEYFDPSQANNFDHKYNKRKNHFRMPEEYFKCFMHLVSEGLDDGFFITEKTVIPIMHQKPFLVQGIPLFHEFLNKELKFELYTEIFNYDFDKIEDYKLRTDGLIQNIKNIVDKDYKKLYEKILPKIKYNQERMIEIINKKVLVPEIVLKSYLMNEPKAEKEINIQAPKKINYIDLTAKELYRHGYARIKNKKNYSFWECDPILRSILTQIPPDSVVNIFIPEENHLATGEISEDVCRDMKNRNIKINFLFGGFVKYDWTEKYDSPENNRYLHLWPTAGIFDNVQEILKLYPMSKLKSHYNDKFTFPFVSLSWKAKDHRCYLVDNLVKHDLLNKGLYTWANEYFHQGTYEWKYADPEKIKNFLDDKFNYFHNNVRMPKDYFNSFLHLVSEGVHDGYFITEKTVNPIMHKKPFIVQGIKGFHKLLKEELKFELFEEIFDYSFDEEEDWTVRTDAVIENLKSIMNEDHTKLYQKLYPKLEYNQNRMIEIINQKIKVPDIVLNSETMKKRFYTLSKNI